MSGEIALASDRLSDFLATTEEFDVRRANRRPIVALTACMIEYAEAGSTVRIECDAVLANTSKIERLEAASEDDLRLAANVNPPRTVDARSKDMTFSA